MDNPSDEQLDALLPEPAAYRLPVQYNLGGAAALEFRTFYMNMFDTVAGQHAVAALKARSIEDAAVEEGSSDEIDTQAAYNDQMLQVLFWERQKDKLSPFRNYLLELEKDAIIPIGDRTAKSVLRMMLDDDEHQDFRERWLAQGHRLPEVEDDETE